MKTLKRTIKNVIVCITVCLLSSCMEFGPNTHKYYGEDIALLVASRQSLMGAEGYFLDKSVLIEEDDYGRILYGFVGSSAFCESKVFAIGIVQIISETDVFYFDGVNIISQCQYRSDNDGPLTIEEIIALFSSPSINALKVANDWGQPLRTNRFFSTPLTHVKPQPLDRQKIEQIIEEVEPGLHYKSGMYFSMDKNGLMIYVIYKSSEADEELVFLVMIDPNGDLIQDTGVLLLTAKQVDNPWMVLNEFKIANGWAFY